MFEHQPELQHVQLLSAGADRWEPHLPAGAGLTTAAGAHASPVSEWILSALLILLRRWPALLRHQDASVWAHDLVQADTLAGKRVLIVGAGHIARATATKLAAFQASATLVGRTRRDGVHGADELHELLSRHDVVVVAAPLTEHTRGLIDAQALAALPDQAILINAGRGPIVDTTALVTAIQAGRLQAALDVTDPEPLPTDHPLWQLDGALISPHTARTVPGTAEACYRIAADHIETLGRAKA
ncbi:phosphoglycerate dehydrogenase [Pseudonocardia sp. KRD-291]|nr:phosphoglycerate dehydrogenase [Pseudonocardia sp. KRD291]